MAIGRRARAVVIQRCSGLRAGIQFQNGRDGWGLVYLLVDDSALWDDYLGPAADELAHQMGLAAYPENQE